MMREERKFPCPACGGIGIVSERLTKTIADSLKPRSSGWIECSERMPSSAKPVLVKIRDKIDGKCLIPQVALYNSVQKFWKGQAIGQIYTDKDELWEVVRWMPIPKEESEE